METTSLISTRLRRLRAVNDDGVMDSMIRDRDSEHLADDAKIESVGVASLHAGPVDWRRRVDYPDTLGLSGATAHVERSLREQRRRLNPMSKARTTPTGSRGVSRSSNHSPLESRSRTASPTCVEAHGCR